MEGLASYEKVERPWGNFERFTLNEATTVKILTVNVGEELSLQTHAHRDEFGRVLKGSGIVHIAEQDKGVHEGDTFFIPRGTKHRALGGPEGLTFLEISFGDFAEDDETRLEDEYGRVP
ncbi:MAG: phosphomannose isomerase type II C-terminal cupin domain [Candidatus Paceibacterota bacterium]|jgi:mannose-6-phosphate isomerase-like protein (cupin superfamily)